MDPTGARVRVSGKFFRAGKEKWYAKGFCYGPFAPNRAGELFPEPSRARQDFALMRELGATCLRTYVTPPLWLLEAALERKLRVFVDIPWEKHRCFFEDWTSQQEARRAVSDAARRLGSHAAVFAISVANEIPNDVVRYYGASRVEAFLDELLDSVHQEAPECLATYANYPTTEFLQPAEQDFCCFNVYLHDGRSWGAYLDRLQHIANGMPLMVGEYGLDSRLHGEAAQAERLVDLTKGIFGHGAAGGFVFSFTDDWFTGGHQIEDWQFGVTTRQRAEKQAARQLNRVWLELPESALTNDLPKASVIVCSYNGASTLAECLKSLGELNYPDYEVLLVDDGSQDQTSSIARQFPQVKYIRQSNQGLSVARNMGLRAATGEIVAYTDSDCLADEDWLLHLVHGMKQQNVDGIGGPNLTPPGDSWTAKCVAASPGNPSHVMFDDRSAEHLPGCNMAFHRKALLAIGGFDPQFRQAGDDVDICWRLLDAGRRLGFAAGAMVWHHRRCTVKAYFRQQKGYGRAEAMLALKHPQRFHASGLMRFDGVIYGDGKSGLPLTPPKVHYGRFGGALFQTIYQAREFRFDARATSLEWHWLAGLLLLLSTMLPPLALISAAMWLFTIRAVSSTASKATLPKERPVTLRLLVYWLHLMQPVVRGLHRSGYTLRNKRLPEVANLSAAHLPSVRTISGSEQELYWETTNGQGRSQLLNAIVAHAQREGWPGDYYGEWTPWDIEMMADLWHHVVIRTATEELGWPRRFTRARWTAQSTRLARATTAVIGIWSGLAVVMQQQWALLAGLAASFMFLLTIYFSRRRCLCAVSDLVARAAKASGLSTGAQEVDAPAPTSWLGKRIARRKSEEPAAVWSADSSGYAVAAGRLRHSIDATSRV